TTVPAFVHDAVWPYRGSGAPTVEVGCQVSVSGSYRPPESRGVGPPPTWPPQTIIRVPVQIAECEVRPVGALTVETASHESWIGSYSPPVFVCPELSSPPQTIISVPLQTAE